jgi:hypothetical protein
MLAYLTHYLTSTAGGTALKKNVLGSWVSRGHFISCSSSFIADLRLRLVRGECFSDKVADCLWRGRNVSPGAPIIVDGEQLFVWEADVNGFMHGAKSP